MNVSKANPSGKVEKVTKLMAVPAGSVVRLQEFTFEEALMGADEATFYMTLAPSDKPDKVGLVSLDGKSLIYRDADRGVIVHKADIQVHEN